MRIALDVQSTLGQKTGIGLYTANLLTALKEVAPQHEYVELSWGRTGELRTPERIWYEQIALPRLARAARADVLHFTGFAASRLRPCPTVLSVHDLIGLLFPANLPPVSRFYWAWWLPRSIRWASALIADSEHTKQDMIRWLHIPSERIEVIYLGVVERYRPIQDPVLLAGIRVRLNLPERFMLYVGTIEPRKGIDVLIKAFAQLASEIPYGLVIAGKKGWYTEPLFAEVKRLGLNTRVYFTDYVADEDLPGLYNLAECFVYPSRYEGFGLPVLEALACGVPVVSTNAASLPEVVGDAALLVPPDDTDALANAIRRVLTEAELARELRAKGPEQARRFTWQDTARRTVAVYERLR